MSYYVDVAALKAEMYAMKEDKIKVLKEDLKEDMKAVIEEIGILKTNMTEHMENMKELKQSLKIV